MIMHMLKWIINADLLKLIALISMTIDHMVKCGYFGSNALWLSHSVGRLAFPIFGFLIMKHFAKGGANIFKKYCVRLSIFGLITILGLWLIHAQITELNVLFTFLWPILFIEFAQKAGKGTALTKSIWGWLVPISVLIAMVPVVLLTDYWFVGFFYLIALYTWFNQPNFLSTCACIMPFLLEPGFSWVFQIMTVAFLLLTNDRIGGKRWMKPWWLCYIYYPLHLIILELLK